MNPPGKTGKSHQCDFLVPLDLWPFSKGPEFSFTGGTPQTGAEALTVKVTWGSCREIRIRHLKLKGASGTLHLLSLCPSPLQSISNFKIV